MWLALGHGTCAETEESVPEETLQKVEGDGLRVKSTQREDHGSSMEWERAKEMRKSPGLGKWAGEQVPWNQSYVGDSGH